MNDDLIGIAAAQRLSGKSASTIRRWCDAKLIKNRKTKNGRRIEKTSLLSYLATEVKVIPSNKKSDTPMKTSEYYRRKIRKYRERISKSEDMISDLKKENKELKHIQYQLQTELIRSGAETRAILAQQTGSKPSSWTRSSPDL